MSRVISMQDMRHMNLFQKITKVRAKSCFSYNELLVFCVQRRYLSQALGKNAENLKKISEVLGKRIRIVSYPNDINEAEKFIREIVNPLEFNEMSFNEDEIIITAGKMNKASLIGREKKRLNDLQKISQDFFGKDLRIV